LLDQGRNVAEYLAVPSITERVIECSGKLCVLDLRLDQKIDGAALAPHTHCGELRVIPWKLAHRMLYRSAVQPGEFRSQDFGLKLNWEAPMDRTCVFYSVSRMER
jgi:hypothetical protein